MIERIEEWDIYFMSMARKVKEKSSCLSRQIGAVLVRNKSIISTGYNGPARGVPHCENRNKDKTKICPRRILGFKSGEGLEMCPAVHAEENCIVGAAKIGVCTEGSILYCDCGVPCKNCLSVLINAGVSEIVFNSLNTTGNFDGIFYDEISSFIAKGSKIKIRSIAY